MAGEKTINGIVEWVNERKGSLKQQLNWPKRFPVNSTYSEALAQCDGQELAQAIAQVILRARAEEPRSSEKSHLQKKEPPEENLIHTAMDGKTLRGTLGHLGENQPSVHLLSLYECESGIVLAQTAVQSKENEISASGAFLHPFLLKGRILSTDAMHTQKKWCAGVDAYGGYYMVIAKDNQPTVRQDLLDFFADPDLNQGEWASHKKVQKGHGRLEMREIWTSTQMNEWFEKEWARIAQIFPHSPKCQKGRKRL